MGFEVDLLVVRVTVVTAAYLVRKAPLMVTDATMVIMTCVLSYLGAWAPNGHLVLVIILQQ